MGGGCWSLSRGPDSKVWGRGGGGGLKRDYIGDRVPFKRGLYGIIGDMGYYGYTGFRV